MTSVAEQFQLLTRGCVDVVTPEELRDRLEESRRTGRPLVVKAGFDPTAPDLHLGHTVLLRKMKHFQVLGHTVVFLIGDFTGLIGDPTGRSVTRRPLTPEEIQANAQTYRQQVFKILDPDRTVIDFNSRWLAALRAEDIVRLCAQFTVARLLAREDFQRRMAEAQPLFLHELLYPLMQAYDSVALRADVELGGQDQLFNLLVGRDLQRAMGQPPQICMTVPLLEGLDGVEKMSKSLGNYVGITEPPDTMFGKLMSISDTLMWRYYELLTDVPLDEIERMKEDARLGRANPRDFKLRLARTIVAEYHGPEAAEAAQRRFIEVFSERRLPADMPVARRPIPDESLSLVTLLVEEGLAPSRSEAKRLIQHGAVAWTVVPVHQNVERADQLERVTDVETTLSVTRPCKVVLRVGKRRFKTVLFGP